MGADAGSISSSQNIGFVWDSVNGLRDLNDVVENELGIDLGSVVLTEAWSVSADNRIIAGQRAGGSFILVIPEPSTALLLAFGLVGIAAIRRRCTAA